MTASTNRNIIINKKIGNDSYTELLPQENAKAITFDNDNELSTGIVGDGAFMTDLCSQPFILGTQSLFFLKDTIYAATGTTPTISVFRRYSLRNGEYFIDVSAYTNTTNAFLLTNMGRLYNSSGTLIYDYRTVLSLSDTVYFSSICYNTMGGRLCVALTCSDGLYYNTTGEYGVLNKLDTSSLGLTSTIFEWVDIINLQGSYYCMGFTISDVVQMPMSTSLSASFTKHIFTTTYGDFKFAQNNIIVGTTGIWFPSITDSVLTIHTDGYTSATQVNVGYGGYLFNDTKYNITHLRAYTTSSKILADLNMPHGITSVTQHCFMFLLNYTNYILGITQNGTLYKITNS